MQRLVVGARVHAELAREPDPRPRIELVRPRRQRARELRRLLTAVDLHRLGAGVRARAVDQRERRAGGVAAVRDVGDEVVPTRRLHADGSRFEAVAEEAGRRRAAAAAGRSRRAAAAAARAAGAAGGPAAPAVCPAPPAVPPLPATPPPVPPRALLPAVPVVPPLPAVARRARDAGAGGAAAGAPLPGRAGRAALSVTRRAGRPGHARRAGGAVVPAVPSPAAPGPEVPAVPVPPDPAEQAASSAQAEATAKSERRKLLMLRAPRRKEVGARRLYLKIARRISDNLLGCRVRGFGSSSGPSLPS